MVLGAGLLAGVTIYDLTQGRVSGVIFPVALVVGIAVGAWVLFLRPHVRLHSDGLVMANVVRDVVIPFAAVDEITTQWALEIHDQHGHKFSSWAVPVRRERVRRKQIDDFAESTSARRGSDGWSAQGVADQVHRTWQRWKLDGGQVGTTSPGLGGGANDRAMPVSRVSWPAVIALVVAAALIVTALLG